MKFRIVFKDGDKILTHADVEFDDDDLPEGEIVPTIIRQLAEAGVFEDALDEEDE
jgi:hypothetical protein